MKKAITLALLLFAFFTTIAQKTRIDSLLVKIDQAEDKDIKSLEPMMDEVLATTPGAFVLLKKGKQDLAKAEKAGLEFTITLPVKT